ncbi:MAG: NAD-dependent epimerase/dehydratase family protein [Myxococcaceae bacterium]
MDDTAALNAVVSELAPECVFHLASALHTAEPQELFRTNVEGTLALLNALEGHDALVVHGSSASVYGEAEQLPIREDHPCVPTNLYGLSKRTAEAVVAIKRTRYVVARIFNIVGPGQTDEHVCGRFARDLVSLNGNSVLRVGPLSATRDFIDVRDVASALLALVSAGEHGHAYNVASGVEVSIREMLKLLAHASGSDARIEESRRQARGVSRNVADISRIQKLGWAPRYSLGQSLSDLMAYQRQCTRPERDDVPRKFSSI